MLLSFAHEKLKSRIPLKMIFTVVLRRSNAAIAEPTFEITISYHKFQPKQIYRANCAASDPKYHTRTSKWTAGAQPPPDDCALSALNKMEFAQTGTRYNQRSHTESDVSFFYIIDSTPLKSSRRSLTKVNQL